MMAAQYVLRIALLICLSITPALIHAQTFSAKNYGPFTDSYEFTVGDFNHDGAADLLGVANFNKGTQTQIYFYLNNGSGGFAAPRAVAGTVGAFGVVVGDFNQDGNLDFAFVTPNSQVCVCHGDG